MENDQETRHEVVSFDSEELILVNDQDQELGFLDKQSCHRGKGTLHRAFSLFIFNRKGELLLQQRSAEKPLWPEYWSNSCCSHPRRGESMALATRRRLRQELGLSCELQYVYKFQYQAQYDETGAEHELCWVFLGLTDATPQVNATEIADWRYVGAADLEVELERHEERFTPWFKMEWQRLNQDYMDLLARFLEPERSDEDHSFSTG
ncbi:MAG: isopentenyl-diphosphate Delta-isomerase [Wenzhouxiangellaceae bacterium]